MVKNNGQDITNNFSDAKIQYLQMIQEPIGRMSTSSAIFKGFSATIVAGITTLSYAEISLLIIALSFVPVLLFLFLDIYYLGLEKRYRDLYEEVRSGNREADFALVLPSDTKTMLTRMFECIKSPSIWLFYPAMILILLTILCMKIKGFI